MKAKLLENMTLDELTDVYLCNKYGKDPVKCLDCEKHETCPAGKRAIELLNEMTASESKWKKVSDGRKIKAIKIAEELSKMEDPIKYLIEVEGSSVHCARERMRRYRMKYPELFTNNPANTKSYSAKRAKNEAERKADYEMAVASDSPIQYYVDKYGVTRDAAWHRWKDAEKKFKTDSEDNNKEEKPMDEISLEDFLKNHDTNETDDPVDTEIEAFQADPKVEPGKMEVQAEMTTDPFLAKYEKLLHERDELLTKIGWYDNAIRSFETVMDIMQD